MRQKIILAAVGIAFSGIPALAASIEGVQGDVSINRGDGFKPALGAEELSPSDRVMVGAGGAAVVIYDAKCKVALREGEAIVIRSQSPCSKLSRNEDGSLDTSKASFLGMQIPTQGAGGAGGWASSGVGGPSGGGGAGAGGFGGTGGFGGAGGSAGTGGAGGGAGAGAGGAGAGAGAGAGGAGAGAGAGAAGAGAAAGGAAAGIGGLGGLGLGGLGGLGGVFAVGGVAAAAGVGVAVNQQQNQQQVKKNVASGITVQVPLLNPTVPVSP